MLQGRLLLLALSFRVAAAAPRLIIEVAELLFALGLSLEGRLLKAQEHVQLEGETERKRGGRLYKWRFVLKMVGVVGVPI